jgi:AcrR family transcriptional regulator
MRSVDEGRQTFEHGRGRPRDARLDTAILAAAEQQLRERGFAGMSLESVAGEAGTTVPSLRRRYANKTSLAVAVVDSLRVEPLQTPRTAPSTREQVLAVLENFRVNLEREHSMALLGTLLAEEQRNPELLQRFRSRLVKPRRTLLADALKAAIRDGELAPETDVEATVTMMIGSFYARYVSHGRIPRDWPRRLVRQIWPRTND